LTGRDGGRDGFVFGHRKRYFRQDVGVKPPDMRAKRRRDAFGMEDSLRIDSGTIEMNDDVVDHVESLLQKNRRRGWARLTADLGMTARALSTHPHCQKPPSLG